MTTQTEFIIKKISEKEKKELFEIKSFEEFVDKIKKSTEYLLAFDYDERVFRISHTRKYNEYLELYDKELTLERTYKIYVLDATKIQTKIDQLIKKEKEIFNATIGRFKIELNDYYEQLKHYKMQQENYKNEFFTHAYRLISENEIIESSRTDTSNRYSREGEVAINIETAIFELNTTLKLKETPQTIIYDVLKNEHTRLFESEIEEIKEEISKEFEI
ncbi:hypothetical protein ES704_03014 [subsurface metagenome]|jgi:hypothetical protein